MANAKIEAARKNLHKMWSAFRPAIAPADIELVQEDYALFIRLKTALSKPLQTEDLATILLLNTSQVPPDQHEGINPPHGRFDDEDVNNRGVVLNIPSASKTPDDVIEMLAGLKNIQAYVPAADGYEPVGSARG